MSNLLQTQQPTKQEATHSMSHASSPAQKQFTNCKRLRRAQATGQFAQWKCRKQTQLLRRLENLALC